MKTRFPLTWLLLMVLACSSSVADVSSSKSFPRFALERSQLRELPPNAAGRHYQLMIGLPESYGNDPTKRYPVVFVTDGYWDFVKIDSIRGSLWYDKVVPEYITVGIGYVGENLDYGRLRAWELLPVSFTGAPSPDSGHAEDFLNTIEQEIIPLIDREYRTDPTSRVLAGASWGGLFTLYTMYTKPNLFHGYIAATPAVMAGNDWLLEYEDKFVKSGRSVSGRLYVTVGAEEDAGFVRSVDRLDKRISERKNPTLAYAFRKIEGERHAGVQWESYVRGLRFVFAEKAVR